MTGLTRVDVIAESDTPVATQYYGSSAIFCLTPCSEDVARRLAKSCEIRPVSRWELPALEKAAPSDPSAEDYPLEDYADDPALDAFDP